MKAAKTTNDIFEMTVESKSNVRKNFVIPKLLPGDEAFDRSTCRKVKIKTVAVEVALQDQTGKRDEGITSMVSYWIVGSTEKFYDAQLLTKQEMLDHLEKDYQDKLDKVLTA